MIVTSLDPVEPFSALIFDCDGTLVNSEPLHFEAENVALKKYGVEFDQAFFDAHQGQTYDTILSSIENKHQIKIDRVEITNHKEDYFIANISNLLRHEPVIEIVLKYYKKVPMAVCSNGPRRLVVNSLKATEIFQYFDTVVTIEDVQNGKPAPDPYLEAARRLNVDPKNCIAYEDSKTGLLSIERAGMRSINVRPFAT